MANTTASAGDVLSGKDLEASLWTSISRLSRWVEQSDYLGYDVFDGLNAKFLRPLTFEKPLLRTLLQQGIRRFPLNLRPLFGVSKSRSTKAMGFFARAFMRLHQATADPAWGEKARFVLEWLAGNTSRGYTGACWGNHFDYQSRSCFVVKGVPSVVWTSLVGHAFLDAYQHFRNSSFLDVAVSSCEHIKSDLGAHQQEDTVCIHYFPMTTHQVHNANALGASLLARVYFHTRNDSYRVLAEKALRYTVRHQQTDGRWYYGEARNLRWVDNFHTAYVLDSLKHYRDATGDSQFDRQLLSGYQYWKNTFFLADGAPKYYSRKSRPFDIQCSAQAIDTLVFFRDRDPASLDLAERVALWTIRHMQDESGFFYYRRYAPFLVNRVPMLHWGQATMLCALAGLYECVLPRRCHQPGGPPLEVARPNPQNVS